MVDNKAGIRFLVDVFIRAYKAGKLRLLFNILIAMLQAKISWDLAMGRLKGEFHGQLVDGAVEKFKSENPKSFECDASGIPGMNAWKEAQGK